MVQATLLLYVDTWVMTPKFGRALGVFHHRVDLHMTGMCLRWYMEGRWVYPQMDVAMMAVVLGEVETYILLHQNSVTQYIATFLIM